MNVLEVVIDAEPISAGRFRVYPIGDLHLDEKGVDRARLNAYIAKIAADPHAMWVLVGDLLSGTTPSHKWFTVGAVDPDVLLNMDRYLAHSMLELERVLEPLAAVPGIIIQGNHDLRHGGTLWSGLCWEIARRLNEKQGSARIQYGGDECIVRLKAKVNRYAKDDKGRNLHYVYVLHAHHGAGGGMYPGGKVNRYENTIGKLTDADVMIRGHVHDSDFRIVPIYTVTKKGAEPRLKTRHRAFITTPSFSPARSEGLNNYASQKGYPPSDEGIMFLNVELPVSSGRSDGKMWREELPI